MSEGFPDVIRASANGFRTGADGFGTGANGFGTGANGFRTCADGFRTCADGFGTSAEMICNCEICEKTRFSQIYALRLLMGNFFFDN